VSEQITPASVESEIMRLSALLEQATQLTARRARAEATAYVAYKSAFARAIVDPSCDGRNREEREAKATLRSLEELDAHRQADALLTASQEAGRNIRQQLSALQSINGNLRHLLTNATGMGG